MVSSVRRNNRDTKGFAVAGVLMAALACVLPRGVLADDAAVPPQPNDPVAAKAYGVFDQNCAGCHQSGKLTGGRLPGGALGNILDLAAVARNASLVVPGNADASPLYTSMQSRAMPLETGDAAAHDITATELMTVRDWIEQLPVGSHCGERERVSGRQVADLVAKAAGDDAAHAATTRYVSLAPLFNACATADELEAARQAVSMLLNSLSPALEPVKLRTVEPNGLLLAIDLAAIGWTAQTWDRLAQRAPATPFLVFDAPTKAKTATATPVINGDWLADAATRAPLYYELLGLPESLPGVLGSLRIDTTDVKRGAAERIGLKTSLVARGNRLLERRSFPNGAAWTSSEYAPTAGRPDMFDMAIAAANASTASGSARPQSLMQPDATLLHFDLPNGFPAFFAANPSGGRINDVPLSVLKDDSHPATRVTVAQSCLSCHGAAPVALAKGRTDDLKARILAESNLPKDARERLLALHPEPADLQRLVDDDRSRFLRVATAAGIDPLRQVGGLGLLPALIARYRRDVTAEELADLVDVDMKTLTDLGRGGSAMLADVIERITFGPVARSDVDAVMAELAVRRGLSVASGSGVVEPVVSAPADGNGQLMRLILKAERPSYQSGDLLMLTARTNASCYLTVLTVNAQGRGTVLYPNEFETNNFVEAGREVRMPGEKAPYQFRLRDKGKETLIGICATAAKTVDGMKHNFEMQRFTELGDYRAFLNRNWDLRDTDDGKPKSKVTRRPGTAASDAAKPDATKADAKPDVQARTAIRIAIE